MREAVSRGTSRERVQLSDEQADSLRHMLGINRPELRDPFPYRDYAAVNPGDAHWLELERLGLVERYATQGGYEWYRTTSLGRALAFASHRRIRWSRDARRYSAYLSVADAIPGLTFRDYLTRPEFADSRRRA